MAENMFPIFDAHMHHSLVQLDEVVASYQECGVIGGINLWWGGIYRADFGDYLRGLRKRNLRNIVPFYWPDWSQFPQDPSRFVSRLCGDMHRYGALGARGLKVWKDLGMYLRHRDGSPATMDDPRLEPVWGTCEELDWVTAVHQADPSHNFKSTTGLTREELFKRRDRVIAAHPHVTFLLCHAGNDVEDVGRFGKLLDTFPNVISEVGRALERHDSTREVRTFLKRYADRLYIGADLGFREDRPVDRRWNLEGCYLPLRKRMTEIWGLTGEALERIAWRNGQNCFLTGPA